MNKDNYIHMEAKVFFTNFLIVIFLLYIFFVDNIVVLNFGKTLF